MGAAGHEVRAAAPGRRRPAAVEEKEAAAFRPPPPTPCDRELLAQRVENGPLDQALREVDLVRVQAHRAGDRADLRRRLLDGRLDVLPLSASSTTLAR